MVGEMLDGSHAYLLAGEALGKLRPHSLWVRWKGTCPDGASLALLILHHQQDSIP